MQLKHILFVTGMLASAGVAFADTEEDRRTIARLDTVSGRGRA
jgi:hypothetical protein